MSKDKKRILYRQKFIDWEHKIYSSLKIWTGQKKRLPICELTAMNLGIILSPHRKREMKDTSFKSWNGCITSD